MKFIPAILITCLLVFACSKSDHHAKPELVIEFDITIKEFRTSPPLQFEQFDSDEQRVFLDLLSSHSSDTWSHASMQKYVSRGEPVLYISLYTPYVRNGKTWADAVMYTYKIRNGVWVQTSTAIT